MFYPSRACTHARPLKFKYMTKEELLQQIKIHNQAYREGHPVISDQEYDDEVSELKK